MAGKVFHVSDGVHKSVTMHCQERGLVTKEWIELVLMQAIKSDGVVHFSAPQFIGAMPVRELLPVVKKKIVASPPSAIDSDLWSRPPFWKK